MPFPIVPAPRTPTFINSPIIYIPLNSGFLFSIKALSASSLSSRAVALPEITIEKVDFVEGEIQITVRNTGPISVEVVMADINDRIQPAAVEPDRYLERYETALVRIPFEWNEAEPYIIGITIEDGTRFEKEIEAAAPALEPNLELLGFFAIIGTYV